MAFTEEEIAYLRSQPLGRLATVARGGQPEPVNLSAAWHRPSLRRA